MFEQRRKLVDRTRGIRTWEWGCSLWGIPLGSVGRWKVERLDMYATFWAVVGRESGPRNWAEERGNSPVCGQALTQGNVP